ncbi:MAG: hypothetical protein NVV74_25115 [Magnetospirillum sp.]|nr:hypothetical protein [Magnetospirillum sp.]
MSRLVLTADLLRPYPDGRGGWESATWKSVRWLEGMVGPAASLAGWEVSTLSWQRDGGGFDTSALYGRLGVPLDFQGWSTLLARPGDFTGEAAMLAEPFAGALVVGVELPEVMLAAFDRAGIAYLDVIGHPVRFLDDLVMAFRTNRSELHAVLLGHRLDPDTIPLQAGLIRAKAAWMAPPVPDLPAGSALVLGQVAEDRALIRPGVGGFASLADHLPLLRQAVAHHPRVYFKPHPYDRPDSPSQQAIRSLPEMGWIGGNLYHLLAQPEIATVYGITSGGLAEAGYFGKQVVALGTPSHRFGDAPGEAVPLHGGWMLPGFWRRLAEGDASLQPAPVLRDNRLRRSLNADWGFGAIDRVIA